MRTRQITVVSGGNLKVETLQAVGAVKMVGTPGPAGKDGVNGAPGEQGPPGPEVDTSTIALDGGNF